MYAYKTTQAAIRAAFTPASPYYGSNTLASWTGGERGSSDLTPQERVAQAAMVYNALKSIVSDPDLIILAAKYTPASSEPLQQAKVAQCRRVAGQLSSRLQMDSGLALDVIFREAGLEPVGSYEHDWARWLDVSPATIYRHAKECSIAYNKRLDMILLRVGARFESDAIAPCG